MKTLKEIQKEAYIFLRSNWTTDQKQIDFIDSLITKAYEAGKKEAIEAISQEVREETLREISNSLYETRELENMCLNGYGLGFIECAKKTRENIISKAKELYDIEL